MAKFVQRRPVEVDLMGERRLRRHLHIIAANVIEGPRPADAEIRTRRGDQRLRALMLFAGRQRRGVGCQPLRQAVALRGVEHHKAFEKRNRAGFALRCLPTFAPIVGGEAVGIENRMPALTLADASASGQRLPEGKPILRRVATFNDRAPQDQHIDARIRTPRNRVARESRHRCRRVPRLRPREATRFKLGDDLGRHLVIKRRPCRSLRLGPACPALAAAPPYPAVIRHRRLPAQKTTPTPERGVGGKKRPRGPARSGAPARL